MSRQADDVQPVLRALGESNRLRLFLALRDKERCERPRDRRMCVAAGDDDDEFGIAHRGGEIGCRELERGKHVLFAFDLDAAACFESCDARFVDVVQAHRTAGAVELR